MRRRKRPEPVMRGHKIVLIALLVAVTALPEAANAQFSPGGIISAATHPLRALLGRLGHYPRGHRSFAAQDTQAPTQSPAAPPAQLGTVGPTAWPTAFEDILGYTFWPGEYAEQVRTRGFDVIAGILVGTLRGPESAKTATTGAAVGSDAPNTDLTKPCIENAGAPDDGMATRIEQTIQPTDAQRDALGNLRTALAQSIKTIKAGCRDTAALSPASRLDLAVQQLWAVRDGGVYVREPLKVLYGSLTDVQKAALAWKQPPERLREGAAAAKGAMGRQFQACAAQSVEGSERMIGQIEQTVRPNKEQSASLEGLRKTSADMAKLLTASCAQPIPADPLARLDSADDQLSSMSYAATSMQIALNEFYIRLDNEQKAKFDSLGR
jgi:hypothetical protein